MTNPLSPAAAVLIAYWKGQDASQQLGVAAALEAVADQVDWESGDPKFLVLAIAAELRALQ